MQVLEAASQTFTLLSDELRVTEGEDEEMRQIFVALNRLNKSSWWWTVGGPTWRRSGCRRERRPR